jgi:DNA mismatch endonuclease (patch repair protein)
MSDVFSSEKRSAVMRSVHGKDTKVELVVRRSVHAMGYRYRLHRGDLPGCPDLVFPMRCKVIFVHGCFWHGHSCARGDRQPQTNAKYWVEKIARNKARDLRNTDRLRELGWQSLIIWECEARDSDDLALKVKESSVKNRG